MKQLNQRGHLNELLIPLILSLLFFVAAGSFGAWAFMSRQDYKNNVEEKVTAAVTVAEQKTSTAKDNEFLEKEKLPLHQYSGPAAFSSVMVMYPKTWSAYVSEKSSGSTPVDSYFHPGFVPAADNSVSYALRVQVLDASYASVVKNYDSNVKNGKLKAAAYIPAKVSSVTGLRLDGEIAPNKQGAMVIVPVRDKTIKIWTESKDFVGDFDTNVLPNYSFLQ